MKKMASMLGMCVVLSASLLLPACGGGEDEATAGVQATCPVMGQPIDKKYYVDHEGKRIYFCCDGCPQTFKADPAKYMKKLAEQGVVLGDAPEDHSGHDH